MTSNRWTREQLKLAFHLYCQLPFGKLDKGNKAVIQLAGLIDRTPSAVALKLVNFASLDPALAARGIKGMGNTSVLDREIWAQFHADWETLAIETEHLRSALMIERGCAEPAEIDSLEIADYTGETRQVISEQRIKQNFFRKAVLSSYRGRCCMSGLSEPRLLTASHIVPWSRDKANRLNPANGLSLCALHDRAFDTGLLTLNDDFRVVLSAALQRKDDPFMQSVFAPLAGKTIEMPERFAPQLAFIRRHRAEVFIDARN
jgi:hypothetical protein